MKPFAMQPCRWPSWAVACLTACCLLFTVPTPAAESRRVLVLYANGRLLPANIEVDRGLVSAFGSHAGLTVDLSAEFLDTPRFSGASYESSLASYLKEKYALQPPEVIIAGGDAALDFLLRHRAWLFAGVPLVHIAVSSDHLATQAPLPQDVIGSALTYDVIGTVEQALRWHPATTRLVLVTGSSAWDLDWEARLRAQAAALPQALEPVYLSGLSTTDLQQHLRNLPAGNIVYTPGYFRDGSGNSFVPRETARLIAEASAVPVYAPFSTFIGSGVVGGRMASYDSMARQGAEATLALLSGAPPGSLKLPATAPASLHLDWRQLQRWGIAAGAVPPGSVVQFEQPGFWQRNQQLVIAAGAVILLQSGLIAALLVERRRRRQAAADLAESEQHMGLAARAAGLSMWTLDTGDAQPRAAGKAAHQEPGRLADFGQSLARIHPHDRPGVELAMQAARANGEEFNVEFRITGLDGEPRWKAARGRVDPGHGQRLLGVAIDITRRKRAEIQAEQDHAALQHMTRVSLLGQLSASIAHQLNQPLASILGNAEAAQQMLTRQPLDLAELRDICDDIVAEDHRAAQVIRRLGALFKRGPPALAALDLNELVHDTLELTRTNLLTQHIVLVTQLAADLPAISGDRVQLQQLLLNLIVNAADAMEAVPQDERQLLIRSENHGNGVRLCVGDRGPGVAADVMGKLFEPFWSTKTGGMGIGLAVCRSIAAAHHGSLDMHNATTGGAVFCTWLPAAAEPGTRR